MKRLIYTLVILSILLPTFTAKVGADDDSYSPKIQQQIIQNCAVIKTTLDNLRKRDISTRVAHVYVNEFLLERTKAFSLRLGNSNLAHATLDGDNQAVEAQLDNFKSDYDQYDDSLTTLRSIDCKSSPQDFYKQLRVTRKQRTNLHKDLTALSKSWARLTKNIGSIDLESAKSSHNSGGNNG